MSQEKPRTVYQQITDNENARSATAIASAAHLKRWLVASGREWLILKATDLVDALPWPDGVETFIHVIECYRQHRMSIPTAWAPCPRPHFAGELCTICNGKGNVVASSKNDVLELDEMKSACSWLLGLIREKEPGWSP